MFDFTQGYDDVRYDMGVAFGLPGVRQNYTLLGYSRTPGGEPSWSFAIPVDEHIDTLTLYPIWQGNDRTMINDDSVATEWMNLVDGSGNLVFADLIGATYKQGQQVTLPGADEIALIQAMDCYKNVKITGWEYNGETRLPGAKITINESDDNPYILLNIVYEEITANVTFDFNGGSYSGEKFKDGKYKLTDEISLEIGTGDDSITPPNNLLCADSLGWEVYIDGVYYCSSNDFGSNLLWHTDIAITLREDLGITDGDHEVVFKLTYGEKELTYSIYSSITGEFIDGGYCSGTDIVLNYTEDQFALEGYKLSHFELDRGNGVIECQPLNGTFNDIRALVPNDNDPCPDLSVTAVYVKADQLLNFTVETAKDTIDCEWLEATAVGKNKLDISKVVALQNCTVRIGTNSVRIYPDSADSECSLYFPMGELSQYVGKTYAFSGSADFCNATYTIEGGADVESATTIKVLTTSSKTFTVPSNATGGELFLKVEVNSFDFSYTDFGQLYGLQIEQNTKSTDYEYYYDDYRLSSVSVDEITTDKADVYAYAKFTIPRAKESVKTINGVKKYFVGWSSDTDLSSVEYYPGEMWSYNSQAGLNLYPVYQEASEDGLTFTLSSNGQYYTVSGFAGDREYYVIPQSYKGIPVTRLSGSSERNTTTKAFIIPEGITFIDWNVFGYCTELTSLHVPSTVKSLSSYSCDLGGFENLNMLTFEKGSQLTSILGGVLAYNSSLKRIELPASITSIGDVGLSTNTKLQQITFEEGSQLSEIGYMVFSNCVSLKSFTIPENVTSIYGSTVSEDASFYGCINLKSVHNLSGLNIVAGSATHGMVAYYADLVVKGGELVEENNILYHIKDGDVIALVVTDKTLSTYTLREDTTILSNKIFNGCTNLESLDLPAGLKKIEGSDDWENGGAFANTTSLNELVIPGECEVGFLTFLNSGVNKISFEGYTSTELNLDYFTYAQEIVIPASVENLLPAVGGPIGTVSFEDPTNWYGVFKGLLVPYDEITDLTVYINNADMGIGMRKIDENIETYGHNYELSEDGTYYILTSLDEVYYPKVPTYYKGLPVKQLGDGVNYLRGPDDDSGYTPCLNLEFETDCQITTIADYAFFGAMLSFKNFILPSSVEYIGDYAFGYSEHYIEIIPAKVKYLGKCAFNYGINRFEIGEGWQYSEDGVTWNWVLDGTTTNLVSFYNANCENMMFRRVEEETQGVNYTLSSDRTHYIVSGGGSNNSEITIKASLYGLPVLGIAEQAFVRNSVIESVTFEEGCQIVNIPVGAFRYMSNLKTLILPDSVKTIEVSALGNNDNLETLILPSGLQSLASWSICNNPKLKTITIPATLTTIENGTFCGCTALEEVVFAEGSKCWEYGESAFEGCSSLKSINMPLDWITIRSNAFYGCGFEEIELPTCMVVASGAFGNCKNLTKLTISGLHNSGITGFKHVFTTVQDLTIVPMIDDYVYDRYYMDFKTNFPNVEKLSISGVKTIDQALFKDNTKLKTLVLSDGLMTIEDVAFSGCTALETVQLPSTLTTVGGYVFNGCINLSEVTIPSGSVLGNGMFCGCTNLTTVNFEDGWSGSIPASAFESCVSLSSIDLSKATSIGNQAFINCKLLTEASLTSSGTIGVSAFSGCSGLDSVEFSDGLTSIDNSAFNGCTALTYIDLPDSLLSIGESAFYNNTGLVEVNIGDSSQLNTIGDRAFQGCDKIKYWYMPSEVETVGPNAFGGLFSCSIISNASALNIKAEAGLNTPANGCIEYYVGQVYDHRVYVDELVVNGVKYYDAYSTQADKDNKTNRLDRIAYGYAAENAGGVTSLILDENTTVISYQAFSGCAFETITIPASVKMIQYKSLANNNSLKTITFEEESQLEYLGGGFYNSPLLESVNLEVCVNLEHIGRYAFYNCPVLTSITIPASVTRIDYSVFSGTSISSLSVSSTGWKYSTDRESWNLVLDGTVTSVAEFMKAHPEYYYKRVLKDIQIQGVNYTLSSDETYYIVSGAESGVTEIVIKDSLYDIPVTEIGANAFDGNKNIIRVEIPENVKIIGEYAFRSCTSITSIVIPVSVEGIRKSAFIGCTSLSYVEFGQIVN
ncbi:MAG: leucine-rich repeat protein [Clostridia bacterium]|nr:leucine-rich repeat protein [Clostridia bacterium]